MQAKPSPDHLWDESRLRDFSTLARAQSGARRWTALRRHVPSAPEPAAATPSELAEAADAIAKEGAEAMPRALQMLKRIRSR